MRAYENGRTAVRVAVRPVPYALGGSPRPGDPAGV